MNPTYHVVFVFKAIIGWVGLIISQPDNIELGWKIPQMQLWPNLCTSPPYHNFLDALFLVYQPRQGNVEH